MNSRHLDTMRRTIKPVLNRCGVLWADEDGTTGLEYALLLALMALSALVAWNSMGEVVADSVEDSAGKAEPVAQLTYGSAATGQPIP